MNNPILIIAIAAIVLAILGFSGIFSAIAGISKILFFIAVGLLVLSVIKKHKGNLFKK